MTEMGIRFIESDQMPPDTIAFIGGPMLARVEVANLPGGSAVLVWTPDLVRMAELGQVVILKGFSLMG